MPNPDDDAPMRPNDGGGQSRAALETEEKAGVCWVCGAPVNERHCKIICPRCGFMRDCSDP